MTNWRDNSPERYGQIFDGDWCVMDGWPDGHRHFVKIYLPAPQRAYPIGNSAACGAAMPDWQADIYKHPLGGVVDCPECLFRANMCDGKRPLNPLFWPPKGT